MYQKEKRGKRRGFKNLAQKKRNEIIQNKGIGTHGEFFKQPSFGG